MNGSFESALDGWTVTGNVQSRTNVAPYSATNGTKFAAFNTSNSTPNGTLSQAFTTSPGATYTLAFDVGVLAYNTQSQQFQVTCNGTSNVLNRSVTVIGPGNGTTRWTPQSFTFTANSSSTVLTFRDTSSTTNAIDLLLDNVRLSDSPSPAAVVSSALEITPEITNPDAVSMSGVPGNLKLSLNSPNGGTYLLQVSEDLVQWETKDEFLAEGPALVEFHDKTPADSDTGKIPVRRFYRIARLPDPE